MHAKNFLKFFVLIVYKSISLVLKKMYLGKKNYSVKYSMSYKDKGTHIGTIYKYSDFQKRSMYTDYVKYY